MDNVVAGALVFAQFLGEGASSWLAAFGIGLWALMIARAAALVGRR
jgi:type IV secretory pathway TrbD component